LSSLASTPSAANRKESNSRREVCAMPSKVLMKQLATAATRKCSGVHRPTSPWNSGGWLNDMAGRLPSAWTTPVDGKSTCELQSPYDIVCRLLHEKKY